MAKKSMILKQQAEPKFSSRRYNRCKICGFFLLFSAAHTNVCGVGEYLVDKIKFHFYIFLSYYFLNDIEQSSYV